MHKEIEENLIVTGCKLDLHYVENDGRYQQSDLSVQQLYRIPNIGQNYVNELLEWALNSTKVLK